VVENSPIVL